MQHIPQIVDAIFRAGAVMSPCGSHYVLDGVGIYITRQPSYWQIEFALDGMLFWIETVRPSSYGNIRPDPEFVFCFSRHYVSEQRIKWKDTEFGLFNMRLSLYDLVAWKAAIDGAHIFVKEDAISEIPRILRSMEKDPLVPEPTNPFSRMSQTVLADYGIPFVMKDHIEYIL